MCNQAVGLIAAECERQGVATVSLQLLREVAEAVRPPRGLLLPFDHGRPLGAAGDAGVQRGVLRAALAMLVDEAGPGPVLREYEKEVPDGSGVNPWE